MNGSSATTWAWRAVRNPSRGRLDAPHRLTLLAAAHLLDAAAAGAGGDMFHHDVLDQAVVGFLPDELVEHVGVSSRTVDRYCRLLVDVGLLVQPNPQLRRYRLPKSAWVAATTSSAPSPGRDAVTDAVTRPA